MNMIRWQHFAPWPLRLSLGAIFILHGLPKLTAPAGVAGFFGQVGIPAPFVMALLIGLLEVIGGALLLVGVGTRPVAALLALNMLGAMITVKFAQGFVGGWEFELILLAAAVSLFFSGAKAPSAEAH